jgi:hypothetical protein
VSKHPLPPRAWPRRPTLILLIAGVLGAHLVLLADGLAGWSPHSPPAAASSAMPKAATVLSRTLAPESAQPRALAVQTSQVRWIAPPVPESAKPAPSRQAAATPRPKPDRVAIPSAASAEPLEPAIAAAVPALQPERLPEAIATEPDLAAAPPSATPDMMTTGPDEQPPPAPAEQAIVVLAETTGQHSDTSASPDGAEVTQGPAQPPASAQLRYSVEGQSKGLNYSASGSLDWRNDGNAYTARMEIRVFLLGSRAQTSEGRLVATGLEPERFADKSRSERAAHFDRPQGRIRFSNNAPDAELLSGAQDRLSVFLQLAGLLNARPEAYPAGHFIAMPVAGVSGSEIWRFQVQGLTSVDLPAGSLIARHLVREPREPRDTRVEIWLAPSLGHLPVRIRLAQENGDVVDQRLSSLP